MLWTKADSETTEALSSSEFQCPVDPSTDLRCATSNDPELFGLLTIDAPATPANRQADVIGIRLRRKPEEAP